MSIENLLILTDEQLAVIAQEGSETAEEILIEKYKGLVRMKARAYFMVGAEPEDVVQEGMIGLVKAIRNFDAGREQTREIKTACDQAGRKYGCLRNEGARGIGKTVQRSTERD